MPRTSAASVVLGCLCFLQLISLVHAETIVDPKLGFTLELSPEFSEAPELVEANPAVVHAFRYGETPEDEIPVFLMIQKLNGYIRQERITEEHLPEGFAGKMIDAQWQGFEVDAFEVPEVMNGVDVLTYNVQIPLKTNGIQVMLFGPADRADELKSLLPPILKGLKGETNWSHLPLPSKFLDEDTYSNLLLVSAIVFVGLGLLAFFYLSGRTPKGTVLVLSIGLYIASWQFEEIKVREVLILSGMMRMLGFAGVILGVIDLFRKRKTKEKLEPEPSPPET